VDPVDNQSRGLDPVSTSLSLEADDLVELIRLHILVLVDFITVTKKN
jgi:hypothetical protein